MQNLYVDTKYMVVKSLTAMIALMRKVEDQMQERGADETTLLESRLAPDMFPFVRQIQIMSDNAKNGIARLAGVVPPVMEDNEATFAALIERLEKTLSFVQTIREEDLREADSRQMTLPYFQDKYMTAEDYTRDSAIPNFYFHFVTAYGLIRMNGYDIGKADFVGGLNLQDL